MPLGLYFLILCVLLTTSNCSVYDLSTSIEQTEEGKFDLRQVDFQKDGLFELRSGWRYYPNRLLLDPPESISDFSEPREGCIYQVRHEMPNPISKQTNLKKPFQFSNNLCGNHELSKEAIPILRGEGYSKIVST